MVRSVKMRFPKYFGFIVLGAAALAAVFYWFFADIDDPERIIEKAARKQARLSSYHAVLDVVLEPGESEYRYTVKTWFVSPDLYRVEIASCYPEEQGSLQQVIVSDGAKAWIYSPEIEDYLELNPLAPEARTPPFLLQGFIDELTGAEIKELIGIEKINGRKSYRLNVSPASPSANRAREEIWLDKNSLMPVKIHSYDRKDQLRQTISFYQFHKEPEINEELFSIFN